MSRIVLLGDAHLREGDPEADLFLEFLDGLPRDVAALYLLGDLFDLWIGAPAFLTPVHRRVVEGLSRLGRSGVRVCYIEGNRDYHLRSLFTRNPFDLLEEEALALEFGGRRLFLAHGDRVNRSDRPYRAWRWLAKGPLLMAFFRLLPPGAASRLAARLEGGIARTNARHRARFPETECREYARERRRGGFDTVVLGHFHQELVRVYEVPEGSVEVFVLPSWREGRRYLAIDGDGAAAFESFRPPSGR